MKPLSTLSNSQPVVEEANHVLQDLRRTLIELYASVGADPEQPQEVARQFNINRNLTWKFSRVISAPDPFAILNHLPGQQGIELVLTGFEKAGASQISLHQVRKAVAALMSFVEKHAGDRERLELTLESMGVFQPEHRAESGRELAFRGNSMIWGIQARTRVVTAFLGPSAMPDATDYLQTSQILGLVRLRPTARWRLSRVQVHTDKGADMPQMRCPEEIDERIGDTPPMLLREFCSPNLPRLDIVDTNEGREFQLPPGEVGNTARYDAAFGYIARGLSAYRTESDPTGSVAVAITLPTEKLIFDLIVHRGVPVEQLPPEALVYGFPHGGLDTPANQNEQNLLPIPLRVTELPGSPPAVATTHSPRYNALAAKAYARMGWNPADFRGFRLMLDHPPMSSKVVLRWRLPERP